jgi:hypothetical protein
MTLHDNTSEDAMFPRWPVTFNPPTRRVVDPPQQVLVSVALALPAPSNTSFRDGIPLRVRSEGLATDMKTQGTLRGWARLSTGGWLGYVDFTVPTGNGQGHLEIHGQWVPSTAITPLR